MIFEILYTDIDCAGTLQNLHFARSIRKFKHNAVDSLRQLERENNSDKTRTNNYLV